VFSNISERVVIRVVSRRGRSGLIKHPLRRGQIQSTVQSWCSILLTSLSVVKFRLLRVSPITVSNSMKWCPTTLILHCDVSSWMIDELSDHGFPKELCMSTNLFELTRIIVVSWGQIINCVHRVSPDIFDFRPSQIVSRCQVFDGAVGAISVSAVSGFHELVNRVDRISM